MLLHGPMEEGGGREQGAARDVTFRLRYEGNEKSVSPRKCVSWIMR